MRNWILATLIVAAIAVVIAPLGGWGEEKISTASVVAQKREPEPAAESPANPATPSATSVASAAIPASEWVAVHRSLVKTKISLAAAVKIAQEKIGSGRVVEAYFKVENSRPLYAVEIVLGGDQHQEVVIDALGGKIVELGAPDREDKSEQEIEEAVAKLKFTIPAAIETASQNMPHARPFDAYAERLEDAIVITVELLDGAEVRSVRIDPNNGAVLSLGTKKP